MTAVTFSESQKPEQCDSEVKSLQVANGIINKVLLKGQSQNHLPQRLKPEQKDYIYRGLIHSTPCRFNLWKSQP